MFVKNKSRVRYRGVQHRFVRKKRRAPDGPKLRARRKKQFKSLLNGFESVVVEEESQRLLAIGRDNLTPFFKFLVMPNSILSNRTKVDALTLTYARGCLKTVTQFLDTVPSPLLLSPRTLVPYAFSFVGLSKDGTRLQNDSVCKRDVSEGHLRNQLCHLILYFRYQYSLQGRTWDLSRLSQRFSLALKLCKRVAHKAFNSADKILRRAQRCAAITPNVYQSLVRKQRLDWEEGLSLFNSAVKADPAAEHRHSAHALQSTLIAGVFLRMPASRPKQVSSYVFVMCLVCP